METSFFGEILYWKNQPHIFRLRLILSLEDESYKHRNKEILQPKDSKINLREKGLSIVDFNQISAKIAR